MAKKHSREKQAEVLRRTQAQRKEQKKEQVLKAISEIQKHSKPLTFKNIATVAGCSISYLYKWDEIKAYIHKLQHQKQTTLNSIEEDNKDKPHSLKTLHEVAKQRIRDLEATIKTIKHQNEKLRGHVAEIYELRDENERLRTQLRELMSPVSSSKVIPIQASTKKNALPAPSEAKDSIDSIIESIKDIEIKVGTKLKQEITNREPEQIRQSIEAFKQYRDSHIVKSQEACLLSMIREEAEPNTESKPKTKKTQQKVVSTPDKPAKKLMSTDKLKQLSNLFNNQDD
ncbi:transposase [Pleurocapsales cyanobacterium LEGE 10410]|nr:transposase [Pleurocapsales cyanobacterium LEGE 10410]